MVRTAPLFGSMLVILALLIGSVSMAADLDTAKDQGLVGELSTGYLGLVVPDADASVRSLVEEINAKRRAEYERIAKANGLSVSDVEQLAAAKAFEKTRPGNYLKAAGHGWTKK